MIDDRALGVLAADTGYAGIRALVVRARSVVRALGVLHALRSALAIRIATVLGYAGADSVVTALGVGSAGRRVTRIGRYRRRLFCISGNAQLITKLVRYCHRCLQTFTR